MTTINHNIQDILFDKDEMTLCFEDGRRVTTPLALYPRLADATPKQRQHWQVLGRGRGIHWPDIDEDLSIEGILRGVPSLEHVQHKNSGHRPTQPS